MRLKAGDAFGPTEKSRNLLAIRAALAEPALARPEWITFDEASTTARLTHLPDGESAPFPLDLQRVVEYYATRL